EPARLAETPRGEFSLEGRSVLVLDDEESICMLLDEGLTAHGLRVQCTASPDEALALVPGQHYDALICDVNLSIRGTSVNGADVAQQLLAASGSPKPSLILMTGDYAEESPAPPGGPERLQKPFRIADVLALLRRTISSN